MSQSGVDFRLFQFSLVFTWVIVDLEPVLIVQVLMLSASDKCRILNSPVNPSGSSSELDEKHRVLLLISHCNSYNPDLTIDGHGSIIYQPPSILNLTNRLLLVSGSVMLCRAGRWWIISLSQF